MSSDNFNFIYYADDTRLNAVVELFGETEADILILPNINYSLLALGSNCHSVELLQNKAVRVVNFKSPVAHTEPIL